MKRISESLLLGICVFLFLQGMYIGIFWRYPDNAEQVRKSETLVNELVDLYTWNYVETQNPRKREQLIAALKRIQRSYGSEPVSIPMVKQCHSIPHYEQLQRITSLIENKRGDLVSGEE